MAEISDYTQGTHHLPGLSFPLAYFTSSIAHYGQFNGKHVGPIPPSCSGYSIPTSRVVTPNGFVSDLNFLYLPYPFPGLDQCSETFALCPSLDQYLNLSLDLNLKPQPRPQQAPASSVPKRLTNQGSPTPAQTLHQSKNSKQISPANKTSNP